MLGYVIPAIPRIVIDLREDYVIFSIIVFLLLYRCIPSVEHFSHLGLSQNPFHIVPKLFSAHLHELPSSYVTNLPPFPKLSFPHHLLYDPQ